MTIETRRSECEICGGEIHRYPHPQVADRWVHRHTADWIDDPHDATPNPGSGR